MTWISGIARCKVLIPPTLAREIQIAHLQIAEDPQIQTVSPTTTNVFIRAVRI
jgi:hypothetical protein